jgi:hypothetical protein
MLHVVAILFLTLGRRAAAIMANMPRVKSARRGLLPAFIARREQIGRC